MKEIPQIGLGTWNLRGPSGQAVIERAIELGYRHLDTAFNYENQKEIGKALKRFERNELFITSKFMPNQGPVGQICDQCLNELEVDFLDLYLVHWPDRSFNDTSIIEELETLKRLGKIARYGVSNFTSSHLRDWISHGADIYCNQVELHPYLTQEGLRDFCDRNQIKVVAYRPLGKGALLTDSVVLSLAAQYGKTPSQILLRWLLEEDLPFLVKASSEKHLQENLDLFDFSLKQEDRNSLTALNQGKRFCRQVWSDFDY